MTQVMINMVELIISVFENIMTIIGVVSALWIYWSWRKDYKAKYTGKLEWPPALLIYYSGTIKYGVIGQVTDDTEMSLILYHLVSEKGEGITKEEIVKKYLKWANSGTPFMGLNTRMLFKGVTTYKGFLQREKKINPDNQSNGALMRCGPLHLLSKEKSLLDCKITNPNDVCIDVNNCYLEMMRKMYDTKEKKEILRYGRGVLENESVLTVFDQALSDEKFSRTVTGTTKGWVLHAFYCVVFSFSKFSSYKEAISTIIRQGGDTDTNAAITGSFFGLYLGLRKIREEEEKNVSILLDQSDKTEKGEFPRSKEYTLEWLKDK